MNIGWWCFFSVIRNQNQHIRYWLQCIKISPLASHRSLLWALEMSSSNFMAANQTLAVLFQPEPKQWTGETIPASHRTSPWFIQKKKDSTNFRICLLFFGTVMSVTLTWCCSVMQCEPMALWRAVKSVGKIIGINLPEIDTLFTSCCPGRVQNSP